MEKYVVLFPNGEYLAWATTNDLTGATCFEEEVARDFVSVFRKHPPDNMGAPLIVEVITI